MKLGALLGLMTPEPQPGELAAQARQLEGLGYDSLWVPQATGRGMMVADPLLVLAAAAVATERIPLGTAVLQLPLYGAAELAHKIFTLMQLTGPRLRIGVGAGSTAKDFGVFERDYDTRFADFRTKLEALRDFLKDGKRNDVDLSPWPNVKGGPPLYYGTWGKGVARAAREFDGWIASGMHRTPDEVIEALGRYREADGGEAIVTTLVLGPEPERGTHRAMLDKYAEAGLDEAVVMLVPGGPSAEEVRSWV